MPIHIGPAKRTQYIVLGGFILFLIGSSLLIFGTMGAGLPLYILSAVFFGLGISSLLAGLRKERIL